MECIAENWSKNGLKYLTNLQFSNLSYLDNKNASAALGGFTHGVRVVDMAKGFATLENGGVYQDNSCIDKIMFKDHEVLKHKIQERMCIPQPPPI